MEKATNPQQRLLKINFILESKHDIYLLQKNGIFQQYN